jgi:hypothetical protein
MTRVQGTFKDKGHYGRKAVGFTIIGLLFPFLVIGEGGRKLAEAIYGVAEKLHKWMKPCLYAPAATEG